jgi:hypothetical protein
MIEKHHWATYKRPCDIISNIKKANGPQVLRFPNLMLILTFILGGKKLVNLGQQNIHGCHGAMRHAQPSGAKLYTCCIGDGRISCPDDSHDKLRNNNE